MDIGELIQAGVKIEYSSEATWAGFKFTFPDGSYFHSAQYSLDSAKIWLDRFLLDQKYRELINGNLPKTPEVSTEQK